MRDFSLKICDFEFSQKEGDEPLPALGTAGYRAPEIRKKECKNKYKADIYSLGIMLFFMRLGYMPYKEDLTKNGYDLQELLLKDPAEFWKAHEEI